MSGGDKMILWCPSILVENLEVSPADVLNAVYLPSGVERIVVMLDLSIVEAEFIADVNEARLHVQHVAVSSHQSVVSLPLRHGRAYRFNDVALLVLFPVWNESNLIERRQQTQCRNLMQGSILALWRAIRKQRIGKCHAAVSDKHISVQHATESSRNLLADFTIGSPFGDLAAFDQLRSQCGGFGVGAHFFAFGDFRSRSTRRTEDWKSSGCSILACLESISLSPAFSSLYVS